MRPRLLLLLHFYVCSLFSDVFVHADTVSSAVMALGSSFTPLGSSQREILISSGQTFAFGFRSLSNGITDGFYVAVWYYNLDNRIVWLANRDASASSTSSLNLTSNGNLLLFGEGGTTIWATDTVGKGVVRAQMEDSGDFVLLNSSGGLIWRSFDNPTDTILPGQQLTAQGTLISRKNAISFASGAYSLGFSSLGGVELKYTEHTVSFPYVNLPGFPVYWSVSGASTPTTGQSVDYSSYLSPSIPVVVFSQSGVASFLMSSSDMYAVFTPADVNADGATRRLTLDLDGNLRTYSWDESLNLWIVVWRSLYLSCFYVQGMCGVYGICSSNPEPVCICPPGFDVVDTNDISQGCTPSIPFDDCYSNKYVALDYTDFMYNDLVDVVGLSMTQCLQKCSSICSCLAVEYSFSGKGECWIKVNHILTGYSPAFYDRIAFLKVSNKTNGTAVMAGPDEITNWTSASFYSSPIGPRSQNTSSISPASIVPGSNPRERSHATILIITLVTVAEILCFGFGVSLVLRKKASTKELGKTQKLTSELQCIGAGAPTIFSFLDLQSATNNFSEELGSGGFGTVYKAQLATGQLAAVKRLDAVIKRDNQFQAEVAAMTSAYHKHLVRLYGFCAEDDHRLLVYEYMQNGSLDSFLFGDPQKETFGGRPILDWKTRFEICLGTARAIAYLHEDCLRCIIHCDIKPQNILIDEDFAPKVADFGLAYLLSRDHTLQVTTVHGTRGYVAPEWQSNLPITAKADVFSFGMVLLEIVSGRNNYTFTPSAIDADKWWFPVWAYERVREGNLVEVVDKKLLASVEWEQVKTVLRVAFWCIQKDVAARPSMREVAEILSGSLSVVDPPPPKLQLS